MKRKKSLGSTILGLLVVALVWFLKEKGIVDDSGGRSGSSGPSPAESSDWSYLKECRLITGRNGDGDSFHVKHEQGETEFRLYYVDTPESEYKTYRGGDSNGKRIAEQGDYFGGLSQQETTAIGQEGKNFVKKLLAKNDFEVSTKWENVYGPERKYCLVQVRWEGEDIYLHELLVARGLARIHTRGTDLPQGRDYRAQKAYLKTVEKTARKKKVGAWRH